MKIALLQLDTVWEKPEENYEKVERMTKEISHEHGDNTVIMVALPEMFATGYTMDVNTYADERRGKTFQFLQNLAETSDVYVLGTAVEVSEEDPKKGENVSYIIDRDGNELARYVKIHPFTYEQEDEYYQSGSEVVTASIEDFVVSPAICYDLRFPELFRSAVLDRANLFYVPANFPHERLDHWRSLLRARAIENQAWIVGVNRTGKGQNLVYPGHSMIVNPWGNIVQEMDQKETSLTVKVSSEQLEEIRGKYPFLQDMKSRFFPRS